jgi:hypothetical protein
MSDKLVIRYVRVSTFEQTTDKYKKEDDEKNGIHTIEEKEKSDKGRIILPAQQADCVYRQKEIAGAGHCNPCNVCR